MAIPLIDTTGEYELFRVHSFAIPRNRANQTTLLASYNLEANAIAVDKKRTQFALLTAEEINACSRHHLHFCTFQSPVYSILGSTACLV